MQATTLLFFILAGGAYGLLPQFSTAPQVQQAATPTEYMRELYYQMYNVNGTARSYETIPPTDVWCISDREVVKQSFVKPQPASRPCSTLTHFTFEWPSLVKALSLDPLQLVSLYLRARLLVNDEAVRESEQILLTMTASLYGDNGRREIDSFEVVQEISLAQPSNQWIEVDLSEEAGKFWEQVKHSSEIRISVETGVMDCYNRIGSPAYVFNPAELPAEADEHRDGAFQPLLLIFTNNNSTQLKPRNQVHNPSNRHKRSHENSCAKHNHMIVFRDIGLTDVLIPSSLNIGKCSGSCSRTILRAHSSLGTNHARIMSTIKTTQDYSLEHGLLITTDGPATTPCCVPDSFNPRTALYMRDDSASLGIRTDYYKDLVVESCTCQ